jgi:lipopolysaccharide transport system permease protein
LVERRGLLFQLVRRDFEQRFVGSAIGWIWGLIHPLVMLASWTFVFGVCLKTPPPPGVKSYPLYLFAGMLPWMLFSDTVNRSASSLLDQASLITKTVFPAEIVPVSVFLSTLVGHLLSLVLLMVASAVWIHQGSYFVFILPLYMVAIGLFAIGLGWIAASLNVFLRDTAQVVAVILTFWFWVTPVMFESDRYPPWARFLFTANPLHYVVRGYRELLLGAAPPDLRNLAVALACGLIAFFVGGLFFRHMKRGFADVL